MHTPHSQKVWKIPVVVKKGSLVLATDLQPLPGFTEGASCELLIDSIYVSDTSRLNKSNGDEVIQFLPKETKLLAQVNAEKVPDDLRDFLHKSPSHIEKCALVEFTLLGDLHLRLRTTREATLLDVGCSSPFLKGREEPPIATSINHVYTLISTYFEPHRISHSGNVFDKVFYQPEGAKDWFPLRHRRDEITRAKQDAVDGQTPKQKELISPVERSFISAPRFDEVLENVMKLAHGDQRRLIDLLKTSTSAAFPNKRIEQVTKEPGKDPINFAESRRMGELFPAEETIDEPVQTVRDLRQDQTDRNIE